MSQHNDQEVAAWFVVLQPKMSNLIYIFAEVNPTRACWFIIAVLGGYCKCKYTLFISYDCGEIDHF